MKASQNFRLTAYGTYGTHGTYGAYETYKSRRSHKSHFGDSQNLDSRPIWRRPPTSKRFAGAVGRRRSCPQYFHPWPHIFDPLAEVAPHRHSLIAVTMGERATRSGLTPNARFKWRVMNCPPKVGI